VRDAEKLVVRHTTAQVPGKTGTGVREKSRDITRLEEQLSDTLATAVTIRVGARNRGELVIAFADLDQLDGVIARLKAPEH
jgi:ParB family chromosome partitioning protein